MRYLAIIPARGGSKGVPGKNLRPVRGKPLVVWSIEQALACAAIDRVVVSTDSAEIAEVARAAGAEVPVMRPASLATDTTPTEPVLWHMLETLESAGYRPDAVILLQPTSPLRLPDSLDNAIARFEESGADSLVSAVETHSFFWRLPNGPDGDAVAEYDFRKRPRRQDIPAADRRYRENGSIYITKASVLGSEGNRLGGRILLFEMDAEESHEIDSLVDFHVVEALMKVEPSA